MNNNRTTSSTRHSQAAQLRNTSQHNAAPARAIAIDPASGVCSASFLAAFCLTLLAVLCIAWPANAQLEIDFSVPVDDPVRSMLGSNHGATVNEPLDEDAGDVRHAFGFWRTGHALWNGAKERFLDEWGIDKITIMMYPSSYGDWNEDLYGSMRRPYDPNNLCGYECTEETYDFSTYERFVNAMVNDAISRGWDTDDRIVWDFWNEGIAGDAEWEPFYDGNFFDGREQDLFATFKVWHDIMRDRMPEAFLVAPSYGSMPSFNEKIDSFMEFVRDNNLTLDALGLHCIAELPVNQQLYLNGLKRLREDYITDDPTHPFYAVGVKELHVNESLGGSHYRAPGSIIGMLTTLEDGGADYGNQNAWENQFDGSLGGRLTPEDKERRPAWWTAYYYKDSLEGRRQFVPNLRRTAGLASAEPTEGLGMAMFGMYTEGEPYTLQSTATLRGLNTLGEGPLRVQLLTIPYDTETRGRAGLNAPLLIQEIITSQDELVLEFDFHVRSGYLVLID